jgi:IS30 family transposase
MAETERKKIDWEKGEKLFRLGQLSAAEIGKQLGCPTSTITRHMRKHGVVQDKRDEVLRRTQEAIATQRNAQRNVAEVTEEDIENAVNSNVALVMSHRRDISKLVEVENKLLDELNSEPTKLYITQYQGNIVEKVVGLTVTEKSSALLNIASVQAKRIEKQRQAFGIEDKGGDSLPTVMIHDPEVGTYVEGSAPDDDA